MQDGAVLKKKFDDIFESSRYTKALDVIRKTRLEYLEKVKESKRDLDVLKLKVIMCRSQSIQTPNPPLPDVDRNVIARWNKLRVLSRAWRG